MALHTVLPPHVHLHCVPVFPVFTYVPGLQSDGLLDGKEESVIENPFTVPQLNEGAVTNTVVDFVSDPPGPEAERVAVQELPPRPAVGITVELERLPKDAPKAHHAPYAGVTEVTLPATLQLRVAETPSVFVTSAYTI